MAGAVRRAPSECLSRDHGGTWLEAHHHEGSYSVDAGSTATDAFMARKDRPTAIFAANDLIAVSVVSRLAGHGFRVRRSNCLDALLIIAKIHFSRSKRSVRPSALNHDIDRCSQEVQNFIALNVSTWVRFLDQKGQLLEGERRSRPGRW